MSHLPPRESIDAATEHDLESFEARLDIRLQLIADRFRTGFRQDLRRHSLAYFAGNAVLLSLFVAFT